MSWGPLHLRTILSADALLYRDSTARDVVRMREWRIVERIRWRQGRCREIKRQMTAPSRGHCEHRSVIMLTRRIFVVASVVSVALFSMATVSRDTAWSSPTLLQIADGQGLNSAAKVSASTRLAQTNTEQPVKKKKPKAKRPGRLPAIGRPPVAARPPVARPPVAGRPPIRPPVAGRPPIRPPVAGRPPIRPPVIVTHPPGWRGARWGAVVAGITLGTIIVVAANSAPPPPAEGLCWTWTNAARTQGYWYYCSGP